MEFDKYTERARGFIQSAQGLAQRSNHLRFAPEHLFKVLLEDKEGLCANLIQSAGGNPALAARDPAAHAVVQPQPAHPARAATASRRGPSRVA